MSAIVDYWNIRTKGQITWPEWQAVLDNPAAFPGFPILRDSNDLPGIPGSGTLLYVGTRFLNAHEVSTDGIDVDLVWTQGLGDFGRLRTELQWTHVFGYTQSFGADATYEFTGTQGPYSVSSGAGTREDRANLIVGWTRGPLAITGTVRYVSDYESTLWQGYAPVGRSRCLSRLDGPDCHVSSFTTLDLSASYLGFRNWQIFGSIINVFNRLAPFNPAAAFGGVNYNYNYALSGARGPNSTSACDTPSHRRVGPHLVPVDARPSAACNHRGSRRRRAIRPTSRTSRTSELLGASVHSKLAIRGDLYREIEQDSTAANCADHHKGNGRGHVVESPIRICHGHSSEESQAICGVQPYPKRGGPATVDLIERLREDDVSLLDDGMADTSRIRGSRQITDLCLPALAVRRDATANAVHHAPEQHRQQAARTVLARPSAGDGWRLPMDRPPRTRLGNDERRF